MGIIYKIINDIDNKLYIGQTKINDLEYKIRRHILDSRKEKNKCALYLQSKNYTNCKKLNHIILNIKRSAKPFGLNFEFLT